jgi:hypothetical protein
VYHAFLYHKVVYRKLICHAFLYHHSVGHAYLQDLIGVPCHSVYYYLVCHNSEFFLPWLV